VSDQHSVVFVRFDHAHTGMLLEDHMLLIHPMTNSNNPKHSKPDISNGIKLDYQKVLTRSEIFNFEDYFETLKIPRLSWDSHFMTREMQGWFWNYFQFHDPRFSISRTIFNLRASYNCRDDFSDSIESHFMTREMQQCILLNCGLQRQLWSQHKGFWDLHNGITTAISTTLTVFFHNIKVCNVTVTQNHVI
jgi:hypothetical protein